MAQLDRNHHYKFVNRPYASSYGRQPHEIIGLHIAEIIGKDAYQTIGRFLDQVSAGQQVESEMEVDFPTIGPRWMVFIFVPEFDANGVLDGFMVVITDITQRKRGEEELEKARDEALAASQAKDNFLSTLSHELRTPLNPVLLLASDAIRDRSLPPHVRADFELIYKNVTLEARLIDDMLDLTRITRGKVTLSPQLLDSHVLLRECVEIVHSDIEDKMIHLELDLAATNSFITANPVRLQQIFWNLLKNALKFTPNDGKIAVRTTNSQDRDLIRVEISDTGIGLTDQEKNNAFQVFSQGEHSEKGGQHRYGGLGLGLAICKRLVEMHHGQIEVASAGRNLGASFFVTLPCSAPRNRTSDLLQATADELAVPLSRSILLVEDHDMTRNILSRLLTRHGHKVSVAACVEEALHAAREKSYDLVISDLGLPDGDGHSLMNELRGTYGMTGIALSGYGMEADINRSLEAGFYKHLTKPVDMEALLKALAEIPKPAP
ncbi:MAG: ATP-binding protein [Chthoniobacteraceae bacterium]